MATLKIWFHECEHNGDLDGYIRDLGRSGARVLRSALNEDAEEGVVQVEVEDRTKFVEAFKQTDSFEFSSLAEV
jgi:hypothetical protein